MLTDCPFTSRGAGCILECRYAHRPVPTVIRVGWRLLLEGIRKRLITLSDYFIVTFPLRGRTNASIIFTEPSHGVKSSHGIALNNFSCLGQSSVPKK